MIFWKEIPINSSHCGFNSVMKSHGKMEAYEKLNKYQSHVSVSAAWPKWGTTGGSLMNETRALKRPHPD